MTIPKFWPKPIPRHFFQNQIFQNRNRDFFPRQKFSETETETFFPRPNFFWNRNRDFFPKPKPKPSNIWQKFRNREVSIPKCQSLLMRFEGTNYDVFSSSLIPVTRWFSWTGYLGNSRVLGRWRCWLSQSTPTRQFLLLREPCCSCKNTKQTKAWKVLLSKK